MSITNTQLYISLAIALTLGGILAYIFWKERRKANVDVKQDQQSDQRTKELQMHAYERLILLAERIALPNLISRVNIPGLSVGEMQTLLTGTIRQEFDHNITQQMYVSAEAWAAVRNLKDQNIHIVNQVASYLPSDASGIDLNRAMLEMLVQNPKSSLHDVVSEVLSFEAKKVMNIKS
jgi:hypothetical protein